MGNNGLDNRMLVVRMLFVKKNPGNESHRGKHGDANESGRHPNRTGNGNGNRASQRCAAKIDAHGDADHLAGEPQADHLGGVGVQRGKAKPHDNGASEDRGEVRAEAT